MWTPTRVRTARLRHQGLLSSQPQSVAGTVRHSLAVQAQDLPFARNSLALRTQATDDQVRQAIDRGEVVRSHLLRPTWHLTSRDDLVWLQRLLGARVERGLTSRHRQLGLAGPELPAGLLGLRQALEDGPLTRRQVGPGLVAAGVPEDGSAIGHLLLVAELRGLICSAGLVAEDQRYTWIGTDRQGVEHWPGDPEQVAGWTDQLVERFVASHGPVSLRDLQRWADLTLGQIRQSLARLPQLEPISVEGVDLVHAPHAAQPEADLDPQRVLCLPVFDEAFLTHRDLGFPRAEHHPSGDSAYRFAEASTGVVLWQQTDVGTWRRRKRGATAQMKLDLAPGLPRSVLTEVDAQLEQLRRYGLGQP